jgi:hypothetical protein
MVSIAGPNKMPLHFQAATAQHHSARSNLTFGKEPSFKVQPFEDQTFSDFFQKQEPTKTPQVLEKPPQKPGIYPKNLPKANAWKNTRASRYPVIQQRQRAKMRAKAAYNQALKNAPQKPAIYRATPMQANALKYQLKNKSAPVLPNTEFFIRNVKSSTNSYFERLRGTRVFCEVLNNAIIQGHFQAAAAGLIRYPSAEQLEADLPSFIQSNFYQSIGKAGYDADLIYKDLRRNIPLFHVKSRMFRYSSTDLIVYTRVKFWEPALVKFALPLAKWLSYFAPLLPAVRPTQFRVR